MEHGRCEPVATELLVDGDLPDHQGVRILRTGVPGDEAGGLTVDPRNHRGVREVAAPQQVRVRGVQIEHGWVVREAPQMLSVLQLGSTNVGLRLRFSECVSHANKPNGMRLSVNPTTVEYGALSQPSSRAPGM